MDATAHKSGNESEPSSQDSSTEPEQATGQLTYSALSTDSSTNHALSPSQLTQTNILMHRISTNQQSPQPSTQINDWATNIPAHLSPLSISPVSKKTDPAADEDLAKEQASISATNSQEEIFQIDLEPKIITKEEHAQLYKNKPTM